MPQQSADESRTGGLGKRMGRSRLQIRFGQGPNGELGQPRIRGLGKKLDQNGGHARTRFVELFLNRGHGSGWERKRPIYGLPVPVDVPKVYGATERFA